MVSVRLFVYGSLKRNGRHHEEMGGATFLGEAVTRPGYRLERLEPDSEYLVLVASEPAPPTTNGAVTGELFAVDESKLRALDAFEGEGYERAEVRLEKYGFALAYLKKAR